MELCDHRTHRDGPPEERVSGRRLHVANPQTVYDPRWMPERIQLPGTFQRRREVEEIVARNLTARECAAVIFPADLL